MNLFIFLVLYNSYLITNEKSGFLFWQIYLLQILYIYIICNYS